MQHRIAMTAMGSEEPFAALDAYDRFQLQTVWMTC